VLGSLRSISVSVLCSFPPPPPDMPTGVKPAFSYALLTFDTHLIA